MLAVACFLILLVQAGSPVRASTGSLNQQELSKVLTKSLTVKTLPAALTPSLRTAQSIVGSIPSLNAYLGNVVACDPVRSPSNIEHPQPCWFGDPSGSRVAVLWGDSSTQAWVYTLSPLFESLHIKLAYFLYSGCYGPNVTTSIAQPGTSAPSCAAWHAALPAAIRALDPSILLSSSAGYSGITSDAKWIAGYAAYFNAFSTPTTTQKYLIGTTPDFPWPVPNCLSIHASNIMGCNLHLTASYSRLLTRDAAIAKAAGATLVTAKNWLCTTNQCPAVIGNYLAYRDFRHFFFPVLDYLRPVVSAAVVAAGLK
jgi:SGNH domain (fused to AT3 domains)